MIELKYLSKTFQMKDGAVKALQNINLTIPDGSTHGRLFRIQLRKRQCFV